MYDGKVSMYVVRCKHLNTCHGNKHVICIFYWLFSSKNRSKNVMVQFIQTCKSQISECANWYKTIALKILQNLYCYVHSHKVVQPQAKLYDVMPLLASFKCAKYILYKNRNNPLVFLIRRIFSLK